MLITMCFLPTSSQWVVTRVLEEFNESPFAAAMTQIDDETYLDKTGSSGVSEYLTCRRAIIQTAEDLSADMIFELGSWVGVTELRFYIQETAPVYLPGES